MLNKKRGAQKRSKLIVPESKRIVRNGRIPKLQKEVSNTRMAVTFVLPLTLQLAEGYVISGYRDNKGTTERMQYEIHKFGQIQPAGYIILERIKGELTITDLFVEPDHRNLGIATYLLSVAVLNHQDQDLYIVIKRRKGERISVQSLQEFYSRFGFAVTEKENIMVKKQVT